MEAKARGGLFSRMFRAMRLDPTLYREVAAPSGSTWQALAVVVIAAAVSGLSWGAMTLAALARSRTAGMDLGTSATQALIPVAEVCAVAQIVAWPVWATGLWILGTRWTSPDREPPWLGAVVRALAFAQAPAVFGAVAVLIVAAIGFALGHEGLRTGFLRVVVYWLLVVIQAWVLAASFLAIREALGLSSVRTVAALVIVGLTIAVLFGIVVVVLTGIGGRESVGLKDNYDLGFRDDGPSAMDVARGFDFNLGFVGHSRWLLYYLSRSALHPFAD